MNGRQSSGLHWLAVLTWGAGICASVAASAGVATFSWRAIGIAGGLSVAGFALLMLLIDIFGKGSAE